MDLQQRLQEFSGKQFFWKRIAVTSTDFNNPDILGFKVKKNDNKKSRSKWMSYLEKYGDRCVEVDAIPAPEIRSRVKQAIESHIDQEAWQFLKDQEAREKQSVLDMVNAFKTEPHGFN